MFGRRLERVLHFSYVRVSLRSRMTVRHTPQPVALARCLDGAIAEAWDRSHGAWSATTALHDVRSRSAVRSATPELRSLSQALRETRAGDPEILQLCRGLLTDGFSSPLYADDAEALRREAGRLRFRLLAGNGGE
jgi:hypothetical protein